MYLSYNEVKCGNWAHKYLFSVDELPSAEDVSIPPIVVSSGDKLTYRRTFMINYDF